MSDSFIGEIRMLPYMYGKVPDGWLACTGQLVPISSYQILYSLLGTRFGGDGVSTFGIPDMRGRVVVGASASPGFVLGTHGGAETVALTAAQGAAHTHAVSVSSATNTLTAPGPSALPGSDPTNTLKHYAPTVQPFKGIDMNDSAVSTFGGSSPHSNIMPTCAINFCICALAGLYPTQP